MRGHRDERPQPSAPVLRAASNGLTLRSLVALWLGVPWRSLSGPVRSTLQAVASHLCGHSLPLRSSGPRRMA